MSSKQIIINKSNEFGIRHAARPRTNARTNHGRQLERAGICACSSVSYRCAALLKRDALELGASEQGLDRDEGVTCVSLPVQSGDDGSLPILSPLLGVVGVAAPWALPAIIDRVMGLRRTQSRLNTLRSGEERAILGGGVSFSSSSAISVSRKTCAGIIEKCAIIVSSLFFACC
jgi:hypothetical protein